MRRTAAVIPCATGRRAGAGASRSRDDPPGDVEKNLELEKLALIINNLDPAEQEIIRLRYVAGLTFAEVAAALGKREDAVKKSLYRLLARVQSQMELP